MKKQQRSYRNENWYKFSAQVRRRDNYKCLKCGRNDKEAILQTHHTVYKTGLAPWEYPLSDCITLCKGCHAREHELIEPDKGWTLISIDDLEDLSGICEKKGCGTEIRYEHLTYHPLWGYKIVGSSCIEHLTQTDQYISKKVLKIYKKISDFVRESVWDRGITINGKHYYYTTFRHHEIRIYGNENRYTFQVNIKRIGEKWFDYGEYIKAFNKTFEQVKEMGIIVLKGLTTDSESEKKILRNIYKSIKN